MVFLFFDFGFNADLMMPGSAFCGIDDVSGFFGQEYDNNFTINGFDNDFNSGFDNGFNNGLDNGFNNGLDNGFNNDFENDQIIDTSYFVTLSDFYKSSDYVSYQDVTPGTTPIHIACGLGRLDVVRQLLHKGFSIDAPCERGWTPLFYATSEGHDKLVQFLCDRDARLNIKNKEKKTVFDLARQSKNTEIINILNKYTTKNKVIQFFKSLFLFWK